MECVEMLEGWGEGEEGGGGFTAGGGGGAAVATAAAAVSAAAAAAATTTTTTTTVADTAATTIITTTATKTQAWTTSSEEETSAMVKEATRLALAFEDGEEDKEVDEKDEEDERAQASRGIWNYTVGLVGKPSAGKSTFFNAAAVPGSAEAAMGAFPFTTISPNMAMGEYEVQAPRGMALEFKPRSDTARVTLMDVAGLVPGAYEGRGKGNQFLNDVSPIGR